MARCLAAARDALDEGERTVGGCDGEDHERVFSPVAGVEKVAIERRWRPSAAVFLATGKLAAMVLTGALVLTSRPCGLVSELVVVQRKWSMVESSSLME